MGEPEETSELLEKLVRGPSSGVAALRDFSEQTARQVVVTEAVSRHLQEQKANCAQHGAEIRALLEELREIRLASCALKETITHLVEKVEESLLAGERKVKWWVTMVPLLVALMALLGVYYTVNSTKDKIVSEQSTLLETTKALSDNQEKLIATLEAVSRGKKP